MIVSCYLVNLNKYLRHLKSLSERFIKRVLKIVVILDYQLDSLST